MSSKWLVQPTIRLSSEAPAENTDEVGAVIFCRNLSHLNPSFLTLFSGASSNLTSSTLQKQRTYIPNLMPTILLSILQTLLSSTSLPFLSLQKLSSLTAYPPSLRKKHKSGKKSGQSSSSDFLIAMFVSLIFHFLQLTRFSLTHRSRPIPAHPSGTRCAQRLWISSIFSRSIERNALGCS